MLKAVAGMLLSSLVMSSPNQECPETEQVRCVDDFRQAYPVCEKAAATGGSDTAADLQCMKYYNRMKAECWPCICEVAKAEHLPVKGCDARNRRH